MNMFLLFHLSYRPRFSFPRRRTAGRLCESRNLLLVLNT